MRRILTVFIALAFGLLAGCGIFSGKEVDETRGWTAQKLYAEARQELSDRNWENAIKHYERIESRYPFGRFAQQAQIEVAYAHWKNDDIASALASIDRFVKLHPNHPSADYMYYLRGLINFNDDLGIMGFFSGQDLSERDPKAAAEAFAAFKTPWAELATAWTLQRPPCPMPRRQGHHPHNTSRPCVVPRSANRRLEFPSTLRRRG